ncbi:MAG: hypothetical protein QM723_04440 [Myxococcaceae bacterium]
MRKVLAVVGLVLVTCGAVAYTVWASRDAMTEVRSEKELVDEREAKRRSGFFDGQVALAFVPETGCAGAALNESIDEAIRTGSSGQAAATARRTWRDQPGCAAAARTLAAALAQLPTGKAELKKLYGEASSFGEASPKDAGLQLSAALFARALGDGANFKRWLERTEAADPSAPLLQSAWGSYWDTFARPRDFRREIDAYESELTRTGDPGALRNLIMIHSALDEIEELEPLCTKYGEHHPLDGPLSFRCLGAALRRGDAAAEARWRKPYFDVPEVAVSEACKHADLAHLLLQACRPDEALAEAQLSIDRGCVVPGTGQRRQNPAPPRKVRASRRTASRWSLLERGEA